MADARYNLITFRDNKLRIFLKADGEMTWNVGLEAAIWSFVLPYTEFAKLGTQPARTGSLEFWWDRLPAVGQLSNLELEDWTIVDATANKYGVPLGRSELQIIEYRIFIADSRHRFKPPFGGFLTDGALNTHPISGSKDGAGKPVVKNSELVLRCCEKLGVTIALLAKVDDLPLVENIKWEKDVAVDELEKLLKQFGCVYVPDLDGTGSIQGIGEGFSPFIGQDQRVADLPLPNFDRRGDTVVFIGPPIVDQVSDRHFTFVIQDDVTDASGVKKTIWNEIHLSSLLNPPGALESFQHGLENVSETYRSRVDSQLYYFLRQDSGEPLLRRNPGTGLNDAIHVEARIAYRLGSGVWVGAKERMNVRPISLEDGQRILCVDQRLITLPVGNIGYINPVEAWRELKQTHDPDTELKITITTEVFDKTGNPKHYRIGFRQVLGKILTLTNDADIDTAIKAGARQIERSELLLHRVNGSDQNLAEIEAIAKQLAPKFIADPKNASSLQVAKGFVQSGLSGKVNELKITQTPPKMEFKVNTAYSPLAGVLPYGKRFGSTASSGSSTSDQAGAAGAQGREQPAVLVSATPRLIEPVRVWAAIVGTGTPISEGQPDGSTREGGGIYPGNGVKLPANIKAIDGGGLGTAFATLNQLQDVVVCNLLEIYTGTNMIAPGTLIFGMLGEPAQDGRPTIWTIWDPSCYRKFRLTSRRIDDVHDKNYGKNITVFQGSRWPNPIVDSQWDDLIPFSPCSPTS
jgi:hypothetical protein